ncbi:glutathione reductase, mitochondrial isoform X2 [Pelecanus crispus]|uniref:glutathione reductase, mitochondrial isoform X2 n=1 Tax=Pelecanus crispus TaxID=36300 RepID=UPI003F5D031B
MWNAAVHAEFVHDHADYGFETPGVRFNWRTIKEKRDAYVRRLNEIYENNIKKAHIDIIRGYGKFTADPEPTIEVDGKKYTAPHILIATGGRPAVPPDSEIPGASLGITSDGFFDLEELPRRSVIVGAGYIAVEIAGILSTLGSKSSLLIRQDKVLRTFDSMISSNCTQELENTGVDVWKHSQVKTVTKSRCGLLDVTVTSAVPGRKPTEGVIRDVDCLLWAVGREPNTEELCLDRVVRWQHGLLHAGVRMPVGLRGVPQVSGGSLRSSGVPLVSRVPPGLLQVSRVPSGLRGSHRSPGSHGSPGVHRVSRGPSGLWGSHRSPGFPWVSRHPSGLQGSHRSLGVPQVSGVPMGLQGSIRSPGVPWVSRVPWVSKVPTGLWGSLRSPGVPQVSGGPMGLQEPVRSPGVPWIYGVPWVSRFPMGLQGSLGSLGFPQVSGGPSVLQGSHGPPEPTTGWCSHHTPPSAGNTLATGMNPPWASLFPIPPGARAEVAAVSAAGRAGGRQGPCRGGRVPEHHEARGLRRRGRLRESPPHPRRSRGHAREGEREDLQHVLHPPVPRHHPEEGQVRHEAGVRWQGGEGGGIAHARAGLRRNAAGLCRGHQNGGHQGRPGQHCRHSPHFCRRAGDDALRRWAQAAPGMAAAAEENVLYI